MFWGRRNAVNNDFSGKSKCFEAGQKFYGSRLCPRRVKRGMTWEKNVIDQDHFSGCVERATTNTQVLEWADFFNFEFQSSPRKLRKDSAPTKIFVSGRFPDRLKQCLGEKGFRWGTWNDRFPAEASKEGRHQPDRGTSSESEEKGHPTRWILCYLAGSSTPDSLGRYWMSCLAQEY